MEVTRDGAPLALPQSKKTRALLAYLAVTGRTHRRERLCTMFWDVPDDPRGALRWSLSKLRALVDEPGRRRLRSCRETVTFDDPEADVDLRAARLLPYGSLADTPPGRLAELAQAFRGEFLQGLDLPNCPEFQAWCVAEREEAHQLHAGILKELIDRFPDDPASALPHARQLVELEPYDVPARSRLVRLLAMIGRRGEAEQQLEAGRRLFRILDADAIELEMAAHDLDEWLARPHERHGPSDGQDHGGADTGPSAAAADDHDELPGQEIRFCAASDGVRIAYATAGSGPVLVKAAGWLTHLEFDWDSPVRLPLYERLARGRRLVRYDGRGNGLSDREAEDMSLDAFVRDLEAVVDALALGRFALYASLQGCAVAIAYAVRHPHRVSRMVLHGGYARGWRKRGAPGEGSRAEALATLMRFGWGQDNPAYHQVFASLFMPGATRQQTEWWIGLQRTTTSPEAAARLQQACGDIDVLALAARVAVPTLVLHARGDAVVPFECGRELAMTIPGARFVGLDSPNHVILEQEPAWERFRAEVEGFLAADAGA